MMLRAAVHRDKINKTNENKEDAMAFKIESSPLDACALAILTREILMDMRSPSP